jgi:AraC-like DNA-binding protein
LWSRSASSANERSRRASGISAPASQIDCRLRQARDCEEFLRAPTGRYLLGRNWLVFLQSDFSGGFLWGDFDVDAFEQFSLVLPVAFAGHARPHPSMLDVRGLEKVDPRVLVMRCAYLERHRADFAAAMTRFATVHPAGFLATLAMGISHLYPPPFPEAFFTERRAALRWLGREDREAIFEQLDAVRAQVCGVTSLLYSLRAKLRDELRLTLAQAGKELGVSARGLQRRLALAGTSFQEEVKLARVQRAQHLLLEPGASVSVVAFRVGCASPQHLSTLFRSVTGETPTGWRDRQRKGGGV